MGRKSSSKSQNQNRPGGTAKEARAAATPPGKSGPSPLILGAVLVAVVGVGLIAFWRPGGNNTAPSTDAAGATASGAATPASQANADVVARAEAQAKLGPRRQANLPPIPFQVGYQPPRSNEVITAAYQFAAEHPEILSYVPCFCGCERSGHQGNHDCFVKQRDANGDVVEWDPHGVDCAVCIDVANRSRQMHSAGASARDIRAAIDKEFGSLNAGAANMPTPHPPQGSH
jgi:hypothetical protein